ncbi:hypothetical protein K435DRAFT_779384 [Dendrothele bispora CBS 962.96]|uniref:Uncharacterized protein n=1 Tax=Dendrothele bispora (strain CBS 962.96) TaxID=1314807 RepID=A0A4S8LXU6_DENBC|nr:hypothetical protein K435DRAFT_779384 [Dendrothele bispora CBS 962.96]
MTTNHAHPQSPSSLTQPVATADIADYLTSRVMSSIGSTLASYQQSYQQNMLSSLARVETSFSELLEPIRQERRNQESRPVS